ncbi:MAG: sensor histidine kinase [Flavitalea sp.]
MALKGYSKRDIILSGSLIVPYTILFNLVLFGSCMLQSWTTFSKSFVYTFIFLLTMYFLFAMVTVYIQKRYSASGDLIRRITVMLPAFYLMNMAFLPGIYYLYNEWSMVSCSTQPGSLLWTIVMSCVISTITIFTYEGLANWSAWKASITEREKLKNAYQRSRVLGLKGQINPHFLFNCFNTLSGLIQDDEKKAEIFLDEMTKVHRYLLRSDEELLVPLEMEIRFCESYLFLAKERFGNAIEYKIDLDSEARSKQIPPLTMQVILENIIYTNALSKLNPLTIKIYCEGDELIIKNTVHEKTVVQNYQVDEGLDNLLNKYRMIDGGEIRIAETENKRIISLPLLERKEVMI